MGPVVLFYVALIGFFTCASMYAVWNWHSNQRDRTLLLFALQCLLIALLSADFVLIALARTASAAGIGFTARVIIAIVTMAVTARMIARLTDHDARFFVNAVAVVAVAVAVYHLAARTWDDELITLSHITFPWGETIAVASRTRMIWTIPVVYVVVTAVNVFGILGAWTLSARDRAGAWLIGLAAGGGVIATSAALAADFAGARVPYFGNVPFALWAVFSGLQLSHRHARTRQLEAEAQQRLRAIFDHTVHFMGLLDVHGTVLEANRPVLNVVGATSSEVVGRPFWETPIWSHSDVLRVKVQNAVQAAAKGERVRFETWHPLRDGGIGYVDFAVTPIPDEHGRVVLLVPEGRDITGRKQTQAALDRLADVVAPHTGQDFFQSMVDALCEICDVDMVMVASIDPANPTKVRTVAVSHGGTAAGNFTYSLMGSPCETVIGRELCYYPENVQQLFPTDTNLVIMGITSYMGIPLLTRNSDEPGLVALMRRGAIRRPDQAKALLQVVAARAGAELERRRSDEALQESEHRFRALIQDLDVGVVMQDASDRIVISNPAAARMLGLTEDELGVASVSDPRWSLVMEDGTPYAVDLLPTVVAARTRQPVHNAIVGATHRQTSARIWMQVTANPRLAEDGSLLHTLITLVDVTDRHRAEEAVRSSSRRLALAISATTDAVWEWNVQTGETYYSPRWFEMFGLPPDTPMTVNTWRERCHPDDLQALDNIGAALSQPHDNAYEVEFRAMRGDGEWFWVLARGDVVERDAEGRPLLMAGTNTDITQRKEAEARRRELEARLAQSHRMEALGRLAGGIAHDFNNMLTVINGYGDLLLQSAKFDPPVTEMLTDIRDAGERAAALTRQLLTFSRHQVVDPDVVELNAVVTDTERMLQRLIGEQIHLETSLSEAPLWVRVDPSQIGQVIINLAVNARDAMPGGGTLAVSTSRVVLDASRAATMVPDAKPGPYAVLAVTDTGTGIPENIRELVFEPFFTTKGPGKGTGLGLTTVHGIVQQSDGMLAVRSQAGVGSTFTVYLPLVDKPRQAHTPVPEQSLEVRARKTVLMVEDEVAVRGVTRQMLRRMGLDVLTAADADEAVRVASAHRRPIDLLLTDVIMPGMNGRQLAERLVALHPTIRVLYMSGYTDDELVQRVVMNADAAYLQKPFDAEALGRKIRQALETAPRSASQ